MRVPFTFTRPGSATYWGADGKLHVAGPDEPRFHYDPVTGKSLGLLVEGQATNYLPHSIRSDFSTTSSYGDVDSFEVIPNAGEAPDGTQTATRVRPLTGEKPFAFRWGNTMANGGLVSFFVRASPGIRHMMTQVSGSNQMFILFDLHTGEVHSEGGHINLFPGIERSKTGWCRVKTWHRTLTSSGYIFNMAFSSTLDAPGIIPTSDFVDLWGFQLGENRGDTSSDIAANPPILDSYIPTSGTPVTRPADILYADMSLVDGFNPTQGTLIIDTDAKEAVTALAESGITIEGVEGKGKLVLTYDEDGGEVYASGAKQYGTPALPATAFKPVAGGIALLREMVVWPRKFSPEESEAAATGSLTVTEWNPSFLFKNGEVGVWFDPSDLDTVFQDAIGTTPGELGQPVGLILDKSQGLELGPELIVNGDFSDGDTGWTLYGTSAVNGGTLTITNDTANGAISGTDLDEGKSYRLTFDVLTYTSGNVRVGTTGSNPLLHNNALPEGSKEFNFTVPPGGGGRLRFGFSSSGGSMEIDNVSLREIPGHHASQPTTTARPILGREPKSGRRNLTSRSEGTYTSYDVREGGETAVDSIDGFIDSVHFQDNTIDRFAYRGPALEAETEYTVSVFVEMDDGQPPAPGDFRINIGNSGHSSFSVEHISANVYRCYRTGLSGTSNLLNTGIVKPVYNSPRGFRFSGLQVELGDQLTPYQRVVSEYDITEEGVDDVYYLAFDGVDDFFRVAGLENPPNYIIGMAIKDISSGGALLSRGSTGYLRIDGGGLYLYNSPERLDISTEGLIVFGVLGKADELSVIWDSEGNSSEQQVANPRQVFPAYIFTFSGTSSIVQGKLHELVASGTNPSITLKDQLLGYLKEKAEGQQ